MMAPASDKPRITPAEFGRRVRALREKARITQDELAGRVGYTRQAISMIELGLSLSTAPGRAAIAAALGVRPEALIAPRTRRGR